MRPMGSISWSCSTIRRCQWRWSTQGGSCSQSWRTITGPGRPGLRVHQPNRISGPAVTAHPKYGQLTGLGHSMKVKMPYTMGNLVGLAIHSMSRAWRKLFQTSGLLQVQKHFGPYMLFDEAKAHIFVLLHCQQGRPPLTPEQSPCSLGGPRSRSDGVQGGRSICPQVRITACSNWSICFLICCSSTCSTTSCTCWIYDSTTCTEDQIWDALQCAHCKNWYVQFKYGKNSIDSWAYSNYRTNWRYSAINIFGYSSFIS